MILFFFCIRSELYYGGDTISTDHPQSFTCPYCGSMGFSESTLSEHVTAQHCDSTSEVVSCLIYLHISSFDRE